MKITDSDVNVNIKEIKKPELNSNLVAENIAQQLVKRVAYRRAMKRAMQSAMRLNAKGIKVMLSGRLAEMRLLEQSGYVKEVYRHTLYELILIMDFQKL